MRKLLVFLSILAIASTASALPYFTVDAADQKDHYQPSDWITIQLVDSNVIGFGIDAITDGGMGGMSSNHIFNYGFGYHNIEAENSNGMLVEYMGAAVTIDPPIPVTGVLYSFEYHIPQATESTIITISSFADGDDYLEPYFVYFGGGEYEGPVSEVTIHVVPEPTTIVLLGLGGLLMRLRK